MIFVTTPLPSSKRIIWWGTPNSSDVDGDPGGGGDPDGDDGPVGVKFEKTYWATTTITIRQKVSVFAKPYQEEKSL
ncbi:8572_t:CDS:2 [Diversispora eburnea]|uniref:8572_t:CDS:1 n=1 Tax=Diversispora eburnea TaxID=1213867 RepID=A0A9N8YRD0_9GLOM|nr:8572_t:CDS:2 [Diversispora eburnea]